MRYLLTPKLFVSLQKLLAFVYERGFFHLLSMNFLIQFIGFGTSLLVAKFLTPVELGEVKIIQSYGAVIIVFAGFGLNSAILKICSEGRDEREKEAFLRYSVIRAAFSTIGAMGILALLALSGLITSSKHLTTWLLIYSAIIPFAVFTNLFVVFLQALKKIKEMAKAQASVKALSFVLIVASSYFWGFPGFIIGTIGAFVLGVLPLLRQVGTRFLGQRGITPPSGFYYVAVYSLLANGVNIIGQYGDIFILDFISNERLEIGFYSLATIFILAANQVTTTVGSIVTPYFSEKSGDEVWFRRELKSNQIRLIILSLVVAPTVFVVAWFLVRYFYGIEYYSSLTYLAILLLKYLIYSSYVVISSAIFGLGLVYMNFIIGSLSTVVALTMGYLWVGDYGVVGAAWAQVLAAFVSLLLALMFIKMALRRTFPPVVEDREGGSRN